MFCTLIKTWGFDQSGRTQGPTCLYIIKYNGEVIKNDFCGKRRVTKMKSLTFVFSLLYNHVMIIVFALNRRFYVYF